MAVVELPQWVPLDCASGFEEARQKWNVWQELAQECGGAIVTVEGWRSSAGVELYSFGTNSYQLMRARPNCKACTSDLQHAWVASGLHKDEWRLASWENLPALESLDGQRWGRYHPGQAFDAEEWRVVEGGWDHEHCQLCNAHICLAPGCGYTEAYATNEDGETFWVCPPCYVAQVAGWIPVEIDFAADQAARR